MSDSAGYLAKKQRLAKILTVIGRKPTLEALQNDDLTLFKLHLADSNKPDGIVRDIVQLAEKRGVPVVYHDKKALSRISKNAKQDQGVALDIQCQHFQTADSFLETPPECFTLLALDRVTNPQNVGMIIRSVAASPIDGLLLPEKGSARLDALVIKASAGTLFKSRLIRCDDLHQTLTQLQTERTSIIGLDVDGSVGLGQFSPPKRVVYVLGNETEGLSRSIQSLCDQKVHIPMANGVESLNVSVTASLIAFRSVLNQNC